MHYSNKAPLPDYIISNDQSIPELKRINLKIPSQDIKFPLSYKDKEALAILEAKHDENKSPVTGLAAPQIGFNKRMIVFSVQDDPKIKKNRKHFVETMNKSIWLNPTYQPISDELNEDYEFCLSVRKITGLVKRFTKIAYAAYLPNGNFIEGKASGFLARIIQHEVDHVNGILFIDKATENSFITIEEYLKLN